MFQHGQKVESRDLREKFVAQEGLTREALAELRVLESRVLATERALLAATRNIPADTPASGGKKARLNMATSVDAGSEMLGSAIVTERTNVITPLVTEEEQFLGTAELLIPGAFWSVASDSAELEVTARISPAYLMTYNEIVVPFIGGTAQTVRLHHPDGYYSYGGTRETLVVRHQRPRNWNGKITVLSTASFRADGKYIHAGAAPWIYNSAWLSSATVRADREMSQAGTFTPYGVYAAPGNILLENPTFKKNGVAFTTSASVVVGDVITVEVTLPWNVAASYLALEHTIV